MKSFSIMVCLLIVLWGCKKPQTEQFRPNTGQIQILNGCGLAGAAEHLRNLLTAQGFDVVDYGNAPSWNYGHTIIVQRGNDSLVPHDLGKVLGVKRIVHLEDSLSLVDASIYIGKDYEELIRQWEKVQP